MKIHEYQGKELLKKFGVAVPRGLVAHSPEEGIKPRQSWAPTWSSLKRRFMQADVAKEEASSWLRVRTKLANWRAQSWE